MAQIRASSLAGSFVTALVLATFPLTPTTARAAGGFITTSGSSFVLSGQEIQLSAGFHDPGFSSSARISSLCSPRRGEGRSYVSGVSDITIGAEDYNRVAGWGINLVRFGLSFTWYQTDRNAFFKSIDGQVAAAHAAGVYLIPVMFTTPADCYEGYGHTCGIWSSGAEQQRLLSFWQDFARHYAGETAIAGYDLLNEPAPPNVSQWLSLAQSIRDAVVAVDANHDVVIEAGSDSLFSGLLGARVIYSVHGYAPLSMTTGATRPSAPIAYSAPAIASTVSSCCGRQHQYSMCHVRITPPRAGRPGARLRPAASRPPALAARAGRSAARSRDGRWRGPCGRSARPAARWCRPD